MEKAFTFCLLTIFLYYTLNAGVIPQEIGKLVNLVKLDVERNQITGSIPISILNISSLQFVSLWRNNLSGSLPREIGNLTKMQILYLSENRFTVTRSLLMHWGGSDVERLVSLTPINTNKQLQVGGSSTFSLNQFANLQDEESDEEDWLDQCFKNVARDADICNNAIYNKKKHGGKNSWNDKVLEEVVSKHLSMRLAKQNHMTVSTYSTRSNNSKKNGSLPMEIFNISRLTIIDLSANNLSGTLPLNIGSTLPNIEILYLYTLTNLVGTIPHSISNCSKLTDLDLSQNKLSGLIPNSLGYLTHLNFLNLWGNNLTSDSFLSFLTSLTNCRNLAYLSLYVNSLNGMLPVSVGNFSKSLVKFYAGACNIKGKIPNEVGNLSNLIDL
ncbi:hypothetical protein H5410_013744, partial [Solanum commersonii]